MVLRILTQASTLTQNVTVPVGPVTPRIYWFFNFFFNKKKKTCIKFTFIYFYLFKKTFRDILEGKLVNKVIIGPVWSVELFFFTSPKLFGGIFTCLGRRFSVSLLLNHISDCCRKWLRACGRARSWWIWQQRQAVTSRPRCPASSACITVSLTSATRTSPADSPPRPVPSTQTTSRSCCYPSVSAGNILWGK